MTVHRLFRGNVIRRSHQRSLHGLMGAVGVGRMQQKRHAMSRILSTPSSAGPPDRLEFPGTGLTAELAFNFPVGSGWYPDMPISFLARR